MLVGFITCLSRAGTGKKEPWFLLLAALQCGLVRALSGWAQQACAEGFQADDVEVVNTLGVVFASICTELDAYAAEPSFSSMNNQLTEARFKAGTSERALEDREIAAAPGHYLAGVWQARMEMLPAMEAAAVWGSQYVVTWGDSSDAGRSGQHSSSSRRNPILAVGHTPKSEQQQQRHQQAAPALLEGPAAAPSSCPLGQLQTELAVGGLLCAHPACPNFEGPSEAALPLKLCGGCRVVAYCSTACSRQDWRRHRPACLAFRHYEMSKPALLCLEAQGCGRRSGARSGLCKQALRAAA